MTSIKSQEFAKKMEEIQKKHDLKMKQLRIQKQAIENRDRANERKERTRRLVQTGALTEKYFGFSDIQKIEKVLNKIVQLDEVKVILAEDKTS